MSVYIKDKSYLRLKNSRLSIDSQFKLTFSAQKLQWCKILLETFERQMVRNDPKGLAALVQTPAGKKELKSGLIQCVEKDFKRSDFEDVGHDLGTIIESHNSRIAKVAGELIHKLQNALDKYRIFKAHEIGSALEQYVIKYGRKRANDAPLIHDTDRFFDMQDVFADLAIGKVKSNHEFIEQYKATLNAAQKHKFHGVVNSILHIHEHAMIWQEFCDNTRLLDEDGGQRSFIESLAQIDEDVIDDFFKPWRRHHRFSKRTGKIEYRDKSISDRTIRRDIQFLKRVMKSANIRTNVMDYVYEASQTSKAKSKVRQTLIPEQICQILNEIQNWKRNKPNRVSVAQMNFIEGGILLELLHGLRGSDLLVFHVAKQGEKTKLIVEAGAAKTARKNREHIANPTAQAVANTVHDFVKNYSAKRFPHQIIQDFFKSKILPIMDENVRVTPHDLRSTAISFMATFHPSEPLMVRDWAGHENTQTTFDTYERANILKDYNQRDLALFWNFLHHYYFDWVNEGRMFNFKNIVEYMDPIEDRLLEEDKRVEQKEFRLRF